LLQIRTLAEAFRETRAEFPPRCAAAQSAGKSLSELVEYILTQDSAKSNNNTVDSSENFCCCTTVQARFLKAEHSLERVPRGTVSRQNGAAAKSQVDFYIIKIKKAKTHPPGWLAAQRVCRYNQ
jgi:hypothetical protein